VVTRPILLVALAACSTPASETCTCTPANTGQTTRQLVEGQPPGPVDGPAIVAALRRHRAMKAANRTPRDIKVLDDELRFAVIDFCSPCGGWVADRMTMEDLFPLDRLDDARSAVCMGLVLRDGSTVYGSTRPAACK
jgi:hypothetical protein